MKKINFNKNLEQIDAINTKINILHAKNNATQKLGLLNHRTLAEDEGIVFTKRRWFHTFGMRFSICVLAFNKGKELIAKPTLVAPNRVFVCPFKSNYVAEVHAIHENLGQEFETKNKIHVLNRSKSKVIFYICKLLPILIVICSLFVTLCSAFALNTINLNLGKTRTINLEQAPQSIQIDDPEIIELERLGISNSIKIIPKQPGKTSLTFQYFDGNDETININVSTLTDEMNQTLQQSPYQEQVPYYILTNTAHKLKKHGINHTIHAGKIFIIGAISSIEKFKEISKIVVPQPTIFFGSFEIDSSLTHKVLDTLNTDIRVMGFQNLKIIQSGERFLLKGVHTSEAGKAKIWSYLSVMLPNIIDATTTFFGESDLVQINIEFWEVGKATKREVGLQYPKLGTEGVGVNFNPDKPTFQITPFSVLFHALEGRNYVREIAKPVIITRSGEKATFLAGGEVPIPAVTSSGPNVNVSVSFKSVGVLFDVTPRVNDDGTIWIKLNVEYSQVNEKLSFQNAPGFNSRKVNTNIILNEGSAAIISGLVQNSEIKKIEGIPFLKSIPIIGELFKSKNYLNDTTELWITISAIHKNSDNPSIRPTSEQPKIRSLFESTYLNESIL